jgi:hypothetical protein
VNRRHRKNGSQLPSFLRLKLDSINNSQSKISEFDTEQYPLLTTSPPAYPSSPSDLDEPPCYSYTIDDGPFEEQLVYEEGQHNLRVGAVLTRRERHLRRAMQVIGVMIFCLGFGIGVHVLIKCLVAIQNSCGMSTQWFYC